MLHPNLPLPAEEKEAGPLLSHIKEQQQQRLNVKTVQTLRRLSNANPASYSVTHELVQDNTGSLERKRAVINQTPSRSVFCRYNEFLKMPQYSLDKPSIRNASPYVGDDWEHYRQDDMAKKKKWIVPKDFKVSFGKATTDSGKSYIKNYVTQTPSNPPMLHKFRSEAPKEDWVGGPLKF